MPSLAAWSRLPYLKVFSTVVELAAFPYPTLTTCKPTTV